MIYPFYTNGLKFSCKRCSGCCRHTPGFVFITYNDLHNLAQATSLTPTQFVKQYCRIVNLSGFQRVSLTEKENYDCIFWEKTGCIVYEKRPLQCKSYPFWNSNLDSLQTWNELAESCPGINEGRLIKKSEIDYWLQLKLKAIFIRVKEGRILMQPET